LRLKKTPGARYLKLCLELSNPREEAYDLVTSLLSSFARDDFQAKL
jgi:hypothetical protein